MNLDNIDAPDFIKKKFGMSEIDDITIQQILNNLMDATKNLNLKTQIDYPHNLSALYLCALILKKLDPAFTVADTIFKYIDIRNEYMVSKGRKGREEIVKAITPMVKEIIQNKMDTKLD